MGNYIDKTYILVPIESGSQTEKTASDIPGAESSAIVNSRGTSPHTGPLSEKRWNEINGKSTRKYMNF